MSTLKLEQVQNPTGKGARSFMVSALAHHPASHRVAGVTADFGCFFDVESGAQGARWKEPSGGDRALFRSDGQLVIVGAALALVTTEGKRSALTKSLFPGVEPMFSATSVGDLAVISVIAGDRTPKMTMRGIDLRTGEARWTQKGFIDGLTAHAGQVYGLEASRVVRVDLATGTLTTLAEGPGALACLHVDDDGLWVCERDAPVIHHFDPTGTHRAKLHIQALDSLQHMTRVRSELLVGGVTLHEVVDGFPQDPPFPISDLFAVDLKLEQATPLGYQDTCTALGWKHADIELHVVRTRGQLGIEFLRPFLRAHNHEADFPLWKLAGLVHDEPTSDDATSYVRHAA
jgi:hypothetical protein